MAMSRSFGGTSFTTLPPMAISPSVMSSRPAIMRSVVVLPQPDGPTSTTNSLSAMSRSMPRTAGTSSYSFTTFRRFTCAIALSPFGRAGGEAGDVVVHEESVDDERRHCAEQRRGHDLAPVEHVALDERADDSRRQHHLVDRGGEGHRVEEIGPRHGEREDGRGDDPGQGDRQEDPGEHLEIARAVDQRRLVELLRDAGEIADHDPGAERHR